MAQRVEKPFLSPSRYFSLSPPHPSFVWLIFLFLLRCFVGKILRKSFNNEGSVEKCQKWNPRRSIVRPTPQQQKPSKIEIRTIYRWRHFPSSKDVFACFFLHFSFFCFQQWRARTFSLSRNFPFSIRNFQKLFIFNTARRNKNKTQLKFQRAFNTLGLLTMNYRWTFPDDETSIDDLEFVINFRRRGSERLWIWQILFVTEMINLDFGFGDRKNENITLQRWYSRMTEKSLWTVCGIAYFIRFIW